MYLRNEGKAPSTVATMMSGIGYVHKLLGCSDPTNSHLVQKTIALLRNAAPSSDTRMPITLPVLTRLVKAADTVITSDFCRRLIKAMMVVAFYGFFRIGELTICPGQSHTIQLENVFISHDKIAIKLMSYKHSKGLPHIISLEKQTDGVPCPHHCLTEYLQVRGRSPGPLFDMGDSQGVPKSLFTQMFKFCVAACNWDTASFHSHSFRIGAATYAAQKGFSDAQIRLMGRWKSNAFRKYIRSPSL